MNWTWDEICNENGIIKESVGIFGEGGRETYKAYFDLEKVGEHNGEFEVKATCTDSDIPYIEKGYEVSFILGKDVESWDIETQLTDFVLFDSNF